MYIKKYDSDGYYYMLDVDKEELDEIRRGLAVAWGEGQTNNRKLNQEMLAKLEELFGNTEMARFYKTYDNKEAL